MIESNMNGLTILRKEVEKHGGDLPRELLKAIVEHLMSLEADLRCGAPYGQRSEQRLTNRNGYLHRDWDTRVGTIPLAIPKLRQGSNFPEWLLEPRWRAERALMQVVVESYLKGVSTRRVDGLVQSMGVQGMSKSQVSELAKELDQVVEQFRSRPLDAGPYTYVLLDAHVQRCREGGRIANVAVVIATGVNVDGHREVLGFDIITTEDGAGWTAFIRSLVARGLNGVCLVISDAHQGLKDAIFSVLPGASGHGQTQRRYRTGGVTQEAGRCGRLNDNEVVMASYTTLTDVTDHCRSSLSDRPEFPEWIRSKFSEIASDGVRLVAWALLVVVQFGQPFEDEVDLGRSSG